MAVSYIQGCDVSSNLGFGGTAITLAFAAILTANGPARAVNEQEPNASLATAQRLEIGPDGRVEVTGAIGNATGLVIADVDFYAFEGRAGDVVTIDINNGMKARFSGLRNVDTIVALFGPGGKLLIENNDAPLPLDSGSVHQFDARIDKYKLTANGTHVVGVSSNPRNFLDGGWLASNTLGLNANGTYTLVISGVSPSLVRIGIEVKPGTSDEGAPVNLKSRGNTPVALLSAPEFDPAEVDHQSLRFGARGDEPSYLRCNKGYGDANADGKPDLLCHFDTQTAGFKAGDVVGIVTGYLKNGRRFEGRDVLKLVPVKSQQ